MMKGFAYFAFVLICMCSVKSDESQMTIFSDTDGYGNFIRMLQPVKRNKFLTDNGYGSRLKAGAKVADILDTYDKVFSKYGPGKRSGLTAPGFPRRTNLFSSLTKRLSSDHGYGSRVSAGTSVADSHRVKDAIFGVQGPGKRSSGNMWADIEHRQL